MISVKGRERFLSFVHLQTLSSERSVRRVSAWGWNTVRGVLQGQNGNRWWLSLPWGRTRGHYRAQIPETLPLSQDALHQDTRSRRWSLGGYSWTWWGCKMWSTAESHECVAAVVEGKQRSVSGHWHTTAAHCGWEGEVSVRRVSLDPSPVGLAPSLAPPWPSARCICSLPVQKKEPRGGLGGILEEVNQPAKRCNEHRVRSVAIRSQERGGGGRVEISHICTGCDCFPLHIL